MFALEHWGVEPDIMSFAKAITSGYLPLGGIMVNEKIHRAILDVPISDTLDARLHLLGAPDLLRGRAGEPPDHGRGEAGRARGA